LGGLKLEEATVKTTSAHSGVTTSAHAVVTISAHSGVTTSALAVVTVFAHSRVTTIPVLGRWTIASAHTGIVTVWQGVLPDTSSIAFTVFPLEGLLTWLLDFRLDSTVIQPSSGVTLGPTD
jgi:hypothetical protein